MLDLENNQKFYMLAGLYENKRILLIAFAFDNSL